LNSRIKDSGLAEKGELQLEWAEAHMPALVALRREEGRNRVLDGVRISAVLHVTKETGVLVRTLLKMGAEVALAGSNPLSTQDEIAAALDKEGVHVYAWRGESQKDYYENLKELVLFSPQVIMDDGADLHSFIHQNSHGDVRVLGGTEETTTGVNRLRVMEGKKLLKYPVVAVNDALSKHLFDNRYGTGQSAVDGILRATNVLLAGKVAVVAGYGWVGRGIAMRLRGMGARVIVTEVDPLRALEAVMDGFDVMPMEDASRVGEVFVTATGNKGVINRRHFNSMKDGAILANCGHFDVEVDVASLKTESVRVRRVRDNLDEYTLNNGRRIYLVAEGRLANLGAAEGHPSEVMDLSFCDQALSVKYLIENKGKLPPKVYPVPAEIDTRVAVMKLNSMGLRIDEPTEEQLEYAASWSTGT
jgi:adenosylhomocysteinase